MRKLKMWLQEIKTIGFYRLTLTLLNATECTNGKNLLQVVAFSRQVMSPCLMQSVAFSRLGVWYTTWILLQHGMNGFTAQCNRIHPCNLLHLAG